MKMQPYQHNIYAAKINTQLLTCKARIQAEQAEQAGLNDGIPRPSYSTVSPAKLHLCHPIMRILLYNSEAIAL